MTESDKDALLVRAALDIMTFQSRVARLAEMLKEAYRLSEMMRRAVRGRSTNPDDIMSLEKAVSLHISLTYHACEKDVARTAKVLRISKPTVYKYLPEQEVLERKRMASHRGHLQSP